MENGEREAAARAAHEAMLAAQAANEAFVKNSSFADLADDAPGPEGTEDAGPAAAAEAEEVAAKAKNEEWVRQHMGEEWMDKPPKANEDSQDQAQAAK